MFITNQGEKKLGPRIQDLISISAQMDMLVGFFYFSGLKVVEEPLRQNKDIKVRVLVGMEIEQLRQSLIEGTFSKTGSVEGIQQRFLESLRTVVKHASMDNQAFIERLKTFIDLLESGRLEIRKTLDPNHAKLYIFTMDEEHKKLREKVWITGSSNFSLPGLSVRDELNVEISDFGTEEATRYFEDLWQRAIPLDDIYDEIKRILLEESVATEITPYEAYYLVVKNFLEIQECKLDEVRLEKLLANAQMTKYAYQVDAVRLALTRLKEHRGVIIADVVGLGKSIIASLVAALSNKNGIIIAPPGLCGDPMRKDSGWYGYIDKFGLNGRWEAFSRGKMDDILEYVKKTPNIEMVIVDEAHWFRNELTDDYGALSLICANKQVVLLTATPFNNNPSDLYALLKLFTPAKSTSYVFGKNLEQLFIRFKSKYRLYNAVEKAMSGGNLEDVTKALQNASIDILSVPNGVQNFEAIRKILAKKRAILSRAIKEVLEKVAIRRNRIDLINDPDYSQEITTLSNVQKPKEQFFELTEEQNAFYDRVIEVYFGGDNPRFKGTVYQPQNYKKDREGEEAYQENIYKMQLHRLVMRFESSFGAFRSSLKNTLRMMKRLQEFVEEKKCFLYSRKAMEEILEAEDDEADALLTEWLDKLNKQFSGKQRTKDPIYNMDPSRFRVKQFKEDMASDIAVFEELLKEVDALKLASEDPKAEALITAIRAILNRKHADIADTAKTQKRKVIVFSIYQDTVLHLKPLLEKAFGKRVLCVTSLGKQMIKTLRADFDASAADQKDDYDILLATDKLSEGHNLNRAGIVINYDIPWNPTRVIQRVGRINRIGKKVFDDLYIFNFYPTVKGSTIAQNRKIAENKMMAIHQILGEDACMFSDEEEPTASGLFTKLNEPLDDPSELSFYTRMKKLYREEMLTVLSEKDRKRLDNLSPRVKTAAEKKPHGVFSFKRQGSSFFAIVHSPGEGVSEWTLEDAISAIGCSKSERKIEHSEAFWKREGGGKGLYDEVVNYNPEPAGTSNNQYLVASTIINRAIDQLDKTLQPFAKMVAEDLAYFGSLSANKVNKIIKIDFNGDPEAIAKLTAELVEIRDVQGEHYLDEIKAKNLNDSIIVTIEQR